MSITDTPTPGTADDLRDEFLAMRAEGASYRTIGAAFGFSYERVRQVIGSGPGSSRKEIKARLHAERVAEVTAYLAENGPTRRSDLMRDLSISPKEWRKLVADIPRSMLLAEVGHSTDYFSEDVVLDSLRNAWQMVQRTEPDADGLSRVQYDMLRGADQISGPRVVARYGSWIEACQAAGVPHGAIMRPSDTYTTQWNDEDLLRSVAAYMAWCVENSTGVTYIGYERWQRDYPEHASGTLIRNRLGLPWTDLVDAARESAAAPA